MATELNIPYEMQSIFCAVATNFFTSQGVNIYYTIPPQTVSPYIKLSSLNIEKQTMSDPSMVTINLGLTIYVDGVSNKQILNIINNLDQDIVPLLNNTTNSAKTVVVKNSYIGDCTATEVIERRAWIAKCNIFLVGGYII